jgi:hypothetical protein
MGRPGEADGLESQERLPCHGGDGALPHGVAERADMSSSGEAACADTSSSGDGLGDDAGARVGAGGAEGVATRAVHAAACTARGGSGWAGIK